LPPAAFGLTITANRSLAKVVAPVLSDNRNAVVIGDCSDEPIGNAQCFEPGLRFPNRVRRNRKQQSPGGLRIKAKEATLGGNRGSDLHPIALEVGQVSLQTARYLVAAGVFERAWNHRQRRSVQFDANTALRSDF